MPRSACTSAHSDQGLHCRLTESLDTTECMNWDQSPDTLRMRRMIWICAVCACSKVPCRLKQFNISGEFSKNILNPILLLKKKKRNNIQFDVYWPARRCWRSIVSRNSIRNSFRECNSVKWIIRLSSEKGSERVEFILRNCTDPSKCTTTKQGHFDVETTSCVYWDISFWVTMSSECFQRRA